MLVTGALGSFWRRERPFELSGSPRHQPALLDAVLFNGEFELLEYRLATLSDHVTQTLLVEADRTFSGAPRELLLTPEELEQRGWEGRVTCLKVVLPAAIDDPLIAMAIQRNHLADLVVQAARPGDRLLIGDLDEVPFPELLPASSPKRHSLGMRQTIYCANHERLGGSSPSHFGAAIVPAEELRSLTLAEIRVGAAQASPEFWEIHQNVGIHLQYALLAERLESHLHDLGHDEATVRARLLERERVRAGEANDDYCCLVSDRNYPGESAPIDEDHLNALLEYAIALDDSRSGRRRQAVPVFPNRANLAEWRMWNSS
ncbi:MAG: hypothetical protein HQ481_05830 [Alphaproteobacteria bacterium]|nr:hypothetical protein [Alphaproteobacteria bacterium]